MNTTKKFWIISNTDIFGATKQELKAKRDELNKAANAVVYRISKGPDHPTLKPFFGEIAIGTFFKLGQRIFKKINLTEGLEVEGAGVPIPTAFKSESQFLLA